MDLSNSQLIGVSFTAMGSPCDVRIYVENRSKGRDVLLKVVKEVRRLDNKYSRYKSDSIISQINSNSGNVVSSNIDQETALLLNYADVCYYESNGLFDVTSGVFRYAWDLKNSTVIPEQSLIDSLRALVDWTSVKWSEHDILLPKKGMEIDFGGIVKEYAADVAASVCFNEGVKSGLIDLGGDIRIVGPCPGNKPWCIYLQDPTNPQGRLLSLNMLEGSVTTSGDYARFREINGVRYSHLINPKTGWPVISNIASVTVLSDHCIVAGSISTIGMLNGKNCLDWMKKQVDLPYLCCDHKGHIVAKNIDNFKQLVSVSNYSTPTFKKR